MAKPQKLGVLTTRERKKLTTRMRLVQGNVQKTADDLEIAITTLKRVVNGEKLTTPIIEKIREKLPTLN